MATHTRTRLAVSATVLLVGAAVSACGGGGSGAPDDASEKDFCQTQTSLLEDLMTDMSDPQLPSDEDMAKAVKDWGKKIEEVGTPEDISDDARKGFERVVEMANDIDPADFSIEKLEELEQGGADASEKAQKQAQAFTDYLTEKCGSPLEDLDLPEMTEMPDSTE